MRIEDFKSGTWRAQPGGFKSFIPALINHEWSWNTPQLNTLLERATLALGQLDAYTRIVPDVEWFIRMHVIKEARQSSRIEGTQTGIDEAVLKREQIDPERRDDWQEVQNYIHAMNGANNGLRTLPLSNRLLRDAHTRLMRGVRGERKGPGEFRRSQNWIGGSGPADAVFVPPPHAEVADLMSDLEAFWHNDTIAVPHLIRAAISHYQFETIHPFQDGNGRIGRLLIPLYLIDKKYLAQPSLYLSDFFERHRAAYYDALTGVRVSNNLLHWIKLFLSAVAETAEGGRRTFEEILKLRQSCEAKVLKLGRRADSGRQLLHALFAGPAVGADSVEKLLGVTPKTANALIAAFVKTGILQQMPGRKRNRLFLFGQYLALFQSPARRS